MLASTFNTWFGIIIFGTFCTILGAIVALKTVTATAVRMIRRVFNW